MSIVGRVLKGRAIAESRARPKPPDYRPQVAPNNRLWGIRQVRGVKAGRKTNDELLTLQTRKKLGSPRI